MDVEGYEHAVVADACRTLADPRLRAVIMETNGSGRRYGWDDDAQVARMREFGFTTCIYDPIARCLTAAPAVRTGSSRRNTLRYCALRRFAA